MNVQIYLQYDMQVSILKGLTELYLCLYLFLRDFLIFQLLYLDKQNIL